MTTEVFRTVAEHCMLEHGDTVGVGLSGGADSVALTHFLVHNKDALGIKSVKAIHVHHGIRGDEADRDLLFVREFCKNLDIELLEYKADIPALAKQSGESLEECARRVRYAFFEQSGCGKIATAHNLNDNMETFLLNVARGSSLSGLCGIPYVRDKYIRPLLNCTRQDIEAYIAENSLKYVTDSTNLCDDYTRNKIRHSVLPHLFEINPSFDKAFSRCMQSVRLSNGYICENAAELLEKSRINGGFDCSVFENCHNALKYQIISMILKEKNAKNISREHIIAVNNIIESGGSADVGGGISVTVRRKKLFFGKTEISPDFELKFKLSDGSLTTPFGEYSVSILFKKDLQNLNKEVLDNLIDCDRISNNPVFRNRREGDRFRPAGRGVTKTLKKLFNECEIPLEERSRMLILCDGGELLWIEGFGASERCKPSDSTEKYLLIQKSGEENA
ncbi:MAG: tRNA lysidine(34) synthetase TilS [Oscillospiraceae bacterium]|nr:tRNA lysidine(34) synthetase TilS [Oscillospiraceae bacterium]